MSEPASYLRGEAATPSRAEASSASAARAKRRLTSTRKPMARRSMEPLGRRRRRSQTRLLDGGGEEALLLCGKVLKQKYLNYLLLERKGSAARRARNPKGREAKRRAESPWSARGRRYPSGESNCLSCQG